MLTTQFSKDAEKLDKKTRNKLADVVEKIQNAKALNDLVDLKKMKGYKTAYRLRFGNYRIGFLLGDQSIKLSRVLSRDEIYKHFP